MCERHRSCFEVDVWVVRRCVVVGVVEPQSCARRQGRKAWGVLCGGSYLVSDKQRGRTSSSSASFALAIIITPVSSASSQPQRHRCRRLGVLVVGVSLGA